LKRTEKRSILKNCAMIEIYNLTKSRVPTKKLHVLFEAVLKKEKKEDKALSVVFVGAAKMRQLNKAYRGKDKATNVLSFSGGDLALGEIVLCPSVILKDALEYKISSKRAFSWMFVHGLLHLLGYTHKTKKEERMMIRKEQQYLSFVL
jgi:probable rRNA maturation factor